MSKILCLGDIHGRNFWRKAIDDNFDKVDKVVFLGDYLDPYPDEIESNPDLMECKSFYDYDGLSKMLLDIISLKKDNPDKVILLTGNHTDGYIWKDFNAATRADEKHWKEYHNIFLENLNLFKLVYIEDDVIFSHAGITQDWANELSEILEFPQDELVEIPEMATLLQDTPLENFNKEYIKAISYVSFWRWGEQQCGSCEWADIREHHNMKMSGSSPKHYDDCYQIFGHTQLKDALITDTWACLDCRKGFIIDGHTIKEC